jgi:hypothetical protein
MKSKEEIANKHGILSGKDSELDDAILNAMQEYATQCKYDMADKIKEAYEQGLSDGYACMPLTISPLNKQD